MSSNKSDGKGREPSVATRAEMPSGDTPSQNVTYASTQESGGKYRGMEVEERARAKRVKKSRAKIDFVRDFMLSLHQVKKTNATAHEKKQMDSAQEKLERKRQINRDFALRKRIREKSTLNELSGKKKALEMGNEALRQDNQKIADLLRHANKLASIRAMRQEDLPETIEELEQELEDVNSAREEYILKHKTSALELPSHGAEVSQEPQRDATRSGSRIGESWTRQTSNQGDRVIPLAVPDGQFLPQQGTTIPAIQTAGAPPATTSHRTLPDGGDIAHQLLAIFADAQESRRSVSLDIGTGRMSTARHHPPVPSFNKKPTTAQDLSRPGLENVSTNETLAQYGHTPNFGHRHLQSDSSESTPGSLSLLQTSLLPHLALRQLLAVQQSTPQAAPFAVDPQQLARFSIQEPVQPSGHANYNPGHHGSTASANLLRQLGLSSLQPTAESHPLTRQATNGEMPQTISPLPTQARSLATSASVARPQAQQHFNTNIHRAIPSLPNASSPSNEQTQATNSANAASQIAQLAAFLQS